MSKKTSKPQNRKKKKTRGVTIRGRARVRVKGDVVGRDKKVQGDEINAGGDANVVKVGAGATMGDIIFDGKRKPKPEELAAAQRAYLEFVIRANQDVKPPSVIDAQNRVTLQLDEIYVPVTITFKELRAETDKKDKRDKSQEEPPKRIELAQSVRDSPRAVLLGEPGAGKTTILRYLPLHFAKTLREHPDYSVNVQDREADFGAARLPIFIRLATFASAKRTLREYVLEAFSDVSAPKETVKQVLAEALSQGKALILLDGLDEVLDNRAYVVDQIESFDAGLQGRNQIIVTSRGSSYGRALGGAFKAFDLNELEPEQIAKFLMYWNLAIEKKRIQENGETFQTEQEYEQAVKERAQEQFTKIAEKIDTNLGAQNLAKNPLTLRMLAETYRWSGDLPNRRVDLYNLIVKQSLEFWEVEVASVPEGKNVSYDEAIDLLGPLAYWMHSEKESPSETEIKDQLKRALKANPDRITPTESIAKSIDNFWTRAKERTGLFVQDTPSHYRFVHATFREYFAGLYLVQDRAQAAQRIYAHRHQPRWEEPILLGFAHASTDDPKFASDLIRTAILAEGEESARLGFESGRYEDMLHRDLLFATKCVRDCVGLDVYLLEQIFGQLSAIYGDTDESSKFPIHERIDAVLRSLRGSEASRVATRFSLKTEIDDEFVFREAVSGRFWILKEWGIGEHRIKTILLHALKDQDAEIRRRAVSSLAGFPNLTPDIIAAFVAALHDEDDRVQGIAAAKLSHGSVPPDSVAELTRLALEWNGIASDEAAARLKNSKGEHPEVTALLIAALQSGDSSVQSRAVYVAEQIGQPIPELVSALLALLQQKEWLQTQLVRWIQSPDRLGTLTKSQLADDFLNIMEETTKERIEIAEIEDILCKRGYRGIDVNYLIANLHGWIAAHNSLRRGVVTTLGKMAYSTPEVINALVTELQRPTLDDFSRLRIAESLAFLGNAGDELVECLTNIYEKIPPKPYSWEREHAIELLGQLKHNNLKAIATLTAALNDENADVQLKAARGLGNLPQMNREVVSALVDRIGDKRIDVHWAREFPPAVRERSDLRWGIARSLGKLASKEPEILAELIELNDPAPELWEQFWSGFAEGNTPIFTSMLLRLLNNPNSEIGARRVSASRFHGLRQVTPEIVQSLAMALQDNDVELRQSAIGSLKYLSDSESGYKSFFLEPLKFTTPEVVNAVLKSLSDNDAEVRSDAVYLVGRMESVIPNAVSLVINAMDDPVIEVRQEASSVLGRLRTVTPKLIMTLLKALNDEDEEVKGNSARGLAELDYEERQWIGFDTSQGIQVADTLRASLDATSEPEIYGSLWGALWVVTATLSTTNQKPTIV
ncbi:MAG: NACHT domain-containing protein [Chloroflexota bacterium]|nr:MAG: NACHT domain-containing protein [Chloroflexota bacterium]